MDEMHDGAPQAAKRKFPFGPQQNQGKRVRGPNRQPLKSSDEIVYTKGGTIQTMPSLGQLLRELTDVAVIGLQNVWEYRSPSKAVPPHYHCKLCNVCQVQFHMFQHVKGWKHSFRYLKKAYPDKVPFEEEDVHKDQALKRTIKEQAVETESTEGRGQLKVILKEPADVPIFKNFYSAHPESAPPAAAGPKPQRLDYRMGGFGGYSTLQDPLTDYSMDSFHDVGHDQMGEEYGVEQYGAEEYGVEDYGAEVYEDYGDYGEYDSYESSTGYAEGYRGHMERSVARALPRPLPRPPQRPPQRPPLRPSQRPINPPPLPPPPPRPANSNGGGDLSGTLLTYLDTFRIENESDAQLVLKVTQKLTDVLMEYRLRHVESSTVPSVFPQSSSTLPSHKEQYSGYQGLPRFPDPPSRYYK